VRLRGREVRIEAKTRSQCFKTAHLLLSKLGHLNTCFHSLIHHTGQGINNPPCRILTDYSIAPEGSISQSTPEAPKTRTAALNARALSPRRPFPLRPSCWPHSATGLLLCGLSLLSIFPCRVWCYLEYLEFQQNKRFPGRASILKTPSGAMYSHHRPRRRHEIELPRAWIFLNAL